MNQPRAETAHVQHSVGPVARGTGWSMVSAFATRGLSWLVTLAVARAFEPSQFGLIALCWVVYNAAVVVRDQAIMSTIIVAEDDRTLRNTVFALNIAISVVVAGGVVALGRPVSSLVGLDAVPLLTLFGAAYLASGLGSVSSGLLQRSLRFRTSAAVEIVAAAAYVTTALVLVASGVGPVSVGWGQLAGASVGTVGVSAAARFRPSRPVSLRAFRRVARYSAGTAAIAVLTFLFTNIDTVWVAARASADDLGQYMLAFNIAVVFAMTLTQVVQKVTFSTHASFLGDEQSGRALLLDSERLILALSLVTSWGLVVFGPEVVGRVFGSSYARAIGPLRVLAVYGLLAAVAAPVTSYLRARGRLRVVVVSLIVQLFLGAAGLTIALRDEQITAAAISVCLALAVGTVIVVRAAFVLADVGRSGWSILPSPTALLALAVPLGVVSWNGAGTVTYCVAAAGFIVYATEILLRERHTPLEVQKTNDRRSRGLLRSLMLPLSVAGSFGIGLVVAIAPKALVLPALVVAAAWLASSRMRMATLTVVALAPVLPIGLFIEVSPSLPLVTASRALVATLVLAGLIAVARGLLRWRRWSAWAALALWIIAVATSVPGSIDPAASRFRLMSEIFEVAAFSGIIYCVFDRSTYRQVLRVLTVGAAIGGLLALTQVFGFDLMAGLRARAATITGRGNTLVSGGDVRLGLPRAQGAFQTPSFLGSGMSLALPIAYALYITERHLKRWWGTCAALITGGLIVSVTRGAWLVALFAVIWTLWVAFRLGYPTLRHLYLGAVAAMVGIVALPTGASKIVKLTGELLDTRADATTSTTNYRIFLHEQVLAVVRDRPVTGYGAGTFDRIGIVGISRGLVVELRSADSHLLRLLAEVGLVGTIAFCFLMATVVAVLVRGRRSTASSDYVVVTSVLASAIGFILLNLTISAFAIAQCSLGFWALVASACAAVTPPHLALEQSVESADRVGETASAPTT